MDHGPRVSEVVETLKSVFLEIPGTQLSAADAARLSGLEIASCRIILEALQDARFLARARGGLFLLAAPDSSNPIGSYLAGARFTSM